ncbi:MAG: biopolymer transporter ExbD [Deltaproteobacteria bacterium]|nr:biopolymer transporter ExbD [Deltaproteobacteria bacterium]
MGGDDDDVMADINITPMVDIILVLLIIFMVTASVINKEAIEVELPSAATGGPTETTSLGIHIDKDGAWYLNGEPTGKEAVRAFIRQEKAAGADLMALIAADKTASHGEVVGAIDLVKQEGVLKFAINIDPVPPPAAAAKAGGVAPVPAPPGDQE